MAYSFLEKKGVLISTSPVDTVTNGSLNRTVKRSMTGKYEGNGKVYRLLPGQNNLPWEGITTLTNQVLYSEHNSICYRRKDVKDLKPNYLYIQSKSRQCNGVTRLESF